jgi:hypothetical protein
VQLPRAAKAIRDIRSVATTPFRPGHTAATDTPRSKRPSAIANPSSAFARPPSDRPPAVPSNEKIPRLPAKTAAALPHSRTSPETATNLSAALAAPAFAATRLAVPLPTSVAPDGDAPIGRDRPLQTLPARSPATDLSAAQALHPPDRSRDFYPPLRKNPRIRSHANFASAREPPAAGIRQETPRPASMAQPSASFRRYRTNRKRPQASSALSESTANIRPDEHSSSPLEDSRSPPASAPRDLRPTTVGKATEEATKKQKASPKAGELKTQPTMAPEPSGMLPLCLPACAERLAAPPSQPALQ